MAAQALPSYNIATGKAEEPIVKELIAKYGYSNLSWPLVLIYGACIIEYLYERNSKNPINSMSDYRPKSSTGIKECFIDYTSSPRVVEPYSAKFDDFILKKYNCSYDYIVNSSYSTVDLDYVWYTGDYFKGFELTTFWMDFTCKSRAEDLVSKISRRPSWKGINGAHALRKVVDSANDLNIDYYMVCVNTVDKVGSDIKTTGNVYYFQLTHEQIDRLSKGLPPTDATFCKFSDFLGWL